MTEVSVAEWLIDTEAIKKNNIGIPSTVSKESYEEELKDTVFEDYESFNDIPSCALETLKNIEIYSIANNNEELFIFEIFSISRIAIVAIEEEKPEITQRVLKMFLESSLGANEKKFERAISMIVANLNLIGKAARKKNLNGSFSRSVFLILYFGILSFEKGYSNSTKLAVTILTEFSEDSAEIVEYVIKKYSVHEIDVKYEPFHEAFKQFLEAYHESLDQRKKRPKEFDDYFDITK